MRRIQLTGLFALCTVAASTAAAQQGQQQQAGPSATESVRTLSKGTQIKVKTSDQISSQTNKVGDTIPAVVTNDVKDASGQVVFPAGARSVLQVIQTPGGSGLGIRSIEVSGRRYGLKSNMRDLPAPGVAGQSQSTAAGPVVSPSDTSRSNAGAQGQVSGSAGVGGVSGQVSGSGRVSGDTGAARLGAQGQVSGDPGPAGAAAQGQISASGVPAGRGGQPWNVFKRNKDGLGYVASDFKQPPVGTDFVIPPGTGITFEFGNDAVPLVTM